MVGAAAGGGVSQSSWREDEDEYDLNILKSYMKLSECQKVRKRNLILKQQIGKASMWVSWNLPDVGMLLAGLLVFPTILSGAVY